MESGYVLQRLIGEFTKKYNYLNNRLALKMLAKMSEEDKTIILSDSLVQKTILSIEDGEILRVIFRNSPSFFQEVMFAHEHIQDLMIAPDKTLKRKPFFENYNYRNYRFTDDSIRRLEVFVHTIKSPLVREQLINNKMFQRIIVLCNEKQLKQSFFRGLDEVQLFYNIVKDEEIYDTKSSRKRFILNLFNNVSYHILLTDDYKDVIRDGAEFIRTKRLISRGFSRVFIDKKTLELFTNDMLEELLNFDNIDREMVESLLTEDIIVDLEKNNYDFKKIFVNLSTGRYDSFKAIDSLYFKVIMEETNENIKVKFIDFIFNILCNTDELGDNDKKIIRDMLYHRINTNSIYKDDYKNLFVSPNYRKTFFYLRFGLVSTRMDYLDGITKDQLMNVNVKHINQIIRSLHVPNEDEISNIYMYAIKMYLIFGLERTISILHGEYGKLDRTFFDNLNSLNAGNVELVKEGKKYVPSINNDFINFMFANKNSNHFRKMVDDSSSPLAKNWAYLFNNLEELKERCHGVLSLKKLNIIFKQLSPTRDIKDVSPDNYKLNENNIINDVCLGNKTSKSNEEVYKNLLDIYDKMKKRNSSSIPYVKGVSSNGYSYEMMKLTDPIAFTLGYKGNCCIRVNDIAHNHLLHATLCRNGRILLIYDGNHNFAGFVPLKRNGELLIANSIECLHKVRDDDAIEAFMESIKDIILQTSESDEPINLVCIGTDAYARPEGVPFPEDISTPTIYEKADSVYQDTDVYHKELTIVYKDSKVDLANIRLGNPKVSYQDPRELVRICNFDQASEEKINDALQVINAIRYAKTDIDDLENFIMCRQYGISKCIYNDDWYLLVTNDGEICGDYLSNDFRAEKEFNVAVLEYQNQIKESNQEVKPLVLQYR